jgi:uncharacterized LabA/DUF88 family protein
MVRQNTTAILVDGAFYRRRSYALFGDKGPDERASELINYCYRHLFERGEQVSSLYRIFYYDCLPLDKNIYHPFYGRPIDMRHTDTYDWSLKFFDALECKRKVAMRFGQIQERESGFRIKAKTINRLFRGEMSLDDVVASDFEPDFTQKGVDMRIGLDIASLANKRLVSQIVLIAGDSDFVPAAKHARREGIDFVLDPMWQGIRPELNRHVDGVISRVTKHPDPENEPLCMRQQ